MVVELCVQNSRNYTIRKMKTNCVDDVSQKINQRKNGRTKDNRKTDEELRAQIKCAKEILINF